MGFESCHPAVNFIFFAAALYGTVRFDHPVFLAIACASAFAYSVRRCGKRAAAVNLGFLPLILAFALYYSSYHHFGVTVLRQNFIGNNLTVESFVCGLVIGLQFATLCMWLEAIFRVVTSDKVVYLFGRVSPRLSLFLTILLRFIPRIGREARKIDRAFVIALFSGITLTAMGAILGATTMFYNPRIIWKPLESVSAVTAAGYAAVCLLPMGLELWTEYRFQRARRRA